MIPSTLESVWTQRKTEMKITDIVGKLYSRAPDSKVWTRNQLKRVERWLGLCILTFRWCQCM